MDTLNILIVGSAVVVLLVLWIIVGARHIKNLRFLVLEQWELVDEGLRKRQDLLPNLIETVRVYKADQEELIETVIKDRIKAAKEYGVSAIKIEYENDLSSDIKKLFALADTDTNLVSDTNFLELRTEIDDLEQNIDDRSNQYNEMVRGYNKSRRSILLRPLAALSRLNSLNIFEFEV